MKFTVLPLTRQNRLLVANNQYKKKVVTDSECRISNNFFALFLFLGSSQTMAGGDQSGKNIGKRQFCFRVGVYRKPPLCKGRWHGVAVTEGLLRWLRSFVFIRKLFEKRNNPSVALRRQLPLHKGAFLDPATVNIAVVSHLWQIQAEIHYIIEKRNKKTSRILSASITPTR